MSPFDRLPVICRVMTLVFVCLLFSAPAHAQWTQCGAPLGGAITAFATSGQTLFAGTYKSGVFRSTDLGNTWVAAGIGLSSQRILSLHVADSTLYAGTDAGVYRSTNQGNSWTEMGLVNKTIYSLDHLGTMLFAGTENGVFSSVDTTGNWTEAGLQDAEITTFMSAGTQLFAGTAGEIFRSTDNGTSWNSISSGQLVWNVRGLVMTAGGSIIAGTENGIYRRMSGDTTWTYSSAGLLIALQKNITTLCTDGGAFYAGTYAGVFRSTDSATAWQSLNSGLPNQYVSTVTVSNTTLFAGMFNGEIWKADLATLSIPNEAYPSSSPLLCYPNPATKSLHIDRTPLSFSAALPVHYTITSVLGEKIIELTETAAQFSIPLPTRATGVYYLTAEQGAERTTSIITIVE